MLLRLKRQPNVIIFILFLLEIGSTLKRLERRIALLRAILAFEGCLKNYYYYVVLVVCYSYSVKSYRCPRNIYI